MILILMLLKKIKSDFINRIKFFLFFKFGPLTKMKEIYILYLSLADVI